ncbi:MAG: hypothetical protein BEN19_02950 [Epulopiscium sp. Nuni2H_MBin003]|nr:MAG: hypothetical protein BEN19_02950 [Epulopiscium sp. Nuni2H_MBin003]
MQVLKFYYKHMKKRFVTHELSPRSAQMAYYWILAIFPFLLMIINLLSYINIDNEILMDFVYQAVPDMVAPLVESIINNMVSDRSQAGIFVGGIVALWSTSAAVNTLIKGIYLAYGVADSRNAVLKKIAGMLYSLLLAFVIIALIVLLIFGNKLGQYVLGLVLHRYPSYYTLIWDFVRMAISVGIIILASLVMHRAIPRRHVKTRKLWRGIIFTAMSWYAFSVLFAYDIDTFSNYSAMYGSLGGVFVLLIWLYTNGLFILIGAEINAIALINSSKIPLRINSIVKRTEVYNNAD